MRTISEVYILEHPFFNMNGPDNVAVSYAYLDIWKSGIERIAQNPNAYAIISTPTEPNVQYEHLHDLLRFTKLALPRNRRDIVKHRFQKPIKSKFHGLFKKSDIQLVSIRGVEVFQGVKDELEHFIKEYEVPKERCYVNFFESETGKMPSELEDLYTSRTYPKRIAPRLSVKEMIERTKTFLKPNYELDWYG